MRKKIPKIFLSYSWKNFSVADQIDNDFQKLGIKLIRDVRDAEDFKSISDFIKRVGKSDYVIMLISDEYLKSKYCLSEVVELLYLDKFEKRALPILLENAETFYTPSKRTRYYRYWQKELTKISDISVAYQKSDFLLEKERIEFINLHLNEFFKKLTDTKAREFKDLKDENYFSLFSFVGFSQVPLLQMLIDISKHENAETRKLKIDDFIIKQPLFIPGLTLKASTCFELKQFSETKHCLKRIIDIDGNNPVALNDFGALLSNVDKAYDAAIAYFKKSIGVNPLNDTAYQNLGTVYNLKLEHIKAIDALRKALELNPTNTLTFFKLGKCYEEIKDFKKALDNYEKAIEIGTNNIEIYLADAAVRKTNFKDFSGALIVLKKALQIDSNNYEIYENLGTAHFRLNNYDEAIECFQKAIAINPKEVFPYRHIASINAIELHNFEMATKFYLKAIEVNPMLSEVYSELGFLNAEHLHDYFQAKWYYERALSIDADNAEINLRYATLLADHLGKREESKLYAEKALLLNPDEEVINHDYACLIINEDPNKALFHFERVLSINPNNQNALLNAATIHIKLQKNYVVAKEYLLKLIGLDYSYPFAHVNLASIYMHEKKYKLAKFHCQQQIKFYPDDYTSYVNLGAILNNDFNDPNTAKFYFEKSIELNSEYFLAHYNLGIVLEILGDITDSKNHFRKAKDLYNPETDLAEHWQRIVAELRT